MQRWFSEFLVRLFVRPLGSFLSRLAPQLVPQSSAQRAAFYAGCNDLLPALPGIFAWGLVTGVAMVKSGLTLPQAFGMTFTVFAGSAQLSSLPLIAANTPLWLIFVAALIINLRFVIYSAALRHSFQGLSTARKIFLGYCIGDIGFVKFMERLNRDPHFPEQQWVFLGGAAANWLAWQIGSCLGIAGAAFIPTHWGLELAGTLALLAVLIPLCLGQRPALVGACVAGVVAVLGHALPLRLGLLLGVVLGISAALMVEAQSLKTPRVKAQNSPPLLPPEQKHD